MHTRISAKRFDFLFVFSPSKAKTSQTEDTATKAGSFGSPPGSVLSTCGGRMRLVDGKGDGVLVVFGEGRFVVSHILLACFLSGRIAVNLRRMNLIGGGSCGQRQ